METNPFYPWPRLLHPLTELCWTLIAPSYRAVDSFAAAFAPVTREEKSQALWKRLAARWTCIPIIFSHGLIALSVLPLWLVLRRLRCPFVYSRPEPRADGQIGPVKPGTRLSILCLNVCCLPEVAARKNCLTAMRHRALRIAQRIREFLSITPPSSYPR